MCEITEAWTEAREIEDWEAKPRTSARIGRQELPFKGGDEECYLTEEKRYVTSGYRAGVAKKAKRHYNRRVRSTTRMMLRLQQEG